MEIEFGRGFDSLLQRSTTDSGISYVSSRSNNKAKKDRRKSKRRSSSRRNLSGSTSTSNNGFNSSNSDLDLSTPEATMVTSTRASVNTSYYEQTSTVSSAFGGDSTTPSFGSKYVRPPAPPPEEEQDALLQSSKMADPNDPLAGHENFQDEFEDEMDEIEMNAERHNFVNLGDMEAKAVAKKRRRSCATWICILIMLGGVVGTVAYLIVSGTGGSKKEKTPQAVPEANTILKLWCAEELDLGPGQSAVFPLQAPKDCQVACNKADCCWNPKSNHFCTPETEHYCEGYKKPCKIMLNGEQYPAEEVTPETPQSHEADHVVPTAPGTLKTICVPQGPAFTATKVCWELCTRADCCWNATSTVQCTADSWQANCAPYEEYCSFYNEHPPGSHIVASHDDDLPFPYAAPDLPNFCDVDNMRQNGPEDCQEQCNMAECCWKVGTVNCASTVPNQMCKDYTRNCAVLNSLDTVLGSNTDNNNGSEDGNPFNDGSNNNNPFPEAPDGLDVYCSPSEMAEISLHICQDKCEPASCCWSTNADPCDARVSAEACQPYVQHCAILNNLASYPGNEPAPAPANFVAVPPSDFDTRCSKENILGAANGGDVLIECEKDCLKAACCWKPGVDGCTDNALCKEYEEHCQLFVGLFQDGSSSGSDTTPAADADTSNSNTGSPNVPQAPADLATTCARDNLSTGVNDGAGIVKCERECLPAACCWKPGHTDECPGASECAAYMEPCATNLVGALHALETGTSIAQVQGTQDSAAAQAVAAACNTQLAIFVKTECEEKCRPGDCCFDDAVACASTVDCSMYDPCGVLHRRNLRHS